MKFALSSLLCLLTLILSTGVVHAGHSQLWGIAGELYEATGRLPDVSWAGVAQGEAPLPEPEVVTTVLDHGAVADGVTDDTLAFRAALDAAAGTGGAVLVPAGEYLVADQLIMDDDGVVLRGEGAGEGGTVLHFPHSLTDLFGWVPQWSWSGGLIHIKGPAQSELVATVVEAAQRGDSTLTLSSAAGLAPGDLIRLDLRDDEEMTLGWHLHADQEAPGTCDWQVPVVRRWPVRVQAVDGDTITLAQPLRTDVRLTWTPEVVRPSVVRGVGVEHLRIAFPDVPYTEHLEEPGYNGIYLSDGVLDTWVRGVTFVHSDTSISVRQSAKHLSFVDLASVGREGHHGIDLGNCHDCLIADYAIGAKMRHGVTVGHHTSGSAIKRLTSPEGRSLSLDHHRNSPIENVFTDIEAPTDWASGGSWCAGPFSGARSTFWHLSGPLVPPLLWSYIQSNMVGDVALGELGTEETFTTHGPWYEHLPDLEPADLHAAQLARRLGQLLPPAEIPDVVDDPGDAWLEETQEVGPDPVVEPDGEAAVEISVPTESEVASSSGETIHDADSLIPDAVVEDVEASAPARAATGCVATHGSPNGRLFWPWMGLILVVVWRRGYHGA